MLVNHKAVMKKISSHKGTTAIWGLSSSTKTFFTKHPKQIKFIDYIIDNNTLLHGETFQEKSIISLENALDKKDLQIVLLGNHIIDILSQIKDYNFTNFLIDYEYSRNYFPKDLIIELDYVYFDKVIPFCNAIVEYCKEKAIQCHIKPYEYSNWPMHETKESVFNNIVAIDIKPPKNTLVFSTHTIGKSNSQIFRWKIGYLDKTITFDETGYSGWSSLAKNPEIAFTRSITKSMVERNFKKLQNHYIAKNISKYEQTHSNFIFPERFIFFPLQTLNDTVMLQSNFDPFTLINHIIEMLYKKGIPLVVKRHPFCDNKLLEKILFNYEKQKKIILFNGSIHDALSKASTIYVINSGVGFEALMHLKPVVTFGKSDYMSVTKHITNLEEIDKNPWYAIDDEKRDKIKLFLHYFIHEKCIDLTNKKDIKNKITSFVVNYLNKEYYGNK